MSVASRRHQFSNRDENKIEIVDRNYRKVQDVIPKIEAYLTINQNNANVLPKLLEWMLTANKIIPTVPNTNSASFSCIGLGWK